ncbi:hypothetical protein CB1_001108008 [Camelus ferus]|nr:hypothetical protein CB1_001108008 [Camelus ferus]
MVISEIFKGSRTEALCVRSRCPFPHREGLSRTSSSRQSSTDSELKSLEPQPWSSTDSDSSVQNMQPPVTKASSFSGIATLTRGDSIGSSKGGSAGRLSRPGSCPQVLLPVSPPQQYNMADDLSNPFGQMSLSRQSSAEAADPSSALFQPPLISQQPQQTGFIMASTGQPLPTSSYSTSSHAPPTPQVLPPQGYMQPPQQIQVSYYPPGQYPNSNQQYRPLSHQVAYSPQCSQQLPQPSQQPGLQPMMPNK